MPPVFLWTLLRLHWGFIVRQLGASAAQLAYALPPPPTVVGAFMNPAARLLGLGEAIDRGAGPAGGRVLQCALKATLAAGAGLDPEAPVPVGVVVYAEPSRINASVYKSGHDYEEAIQQPIYQASLKLLPVQAEGAASAPGARVFLAWLVDLDGLASCLGADPSEVELALNVAARAVYRVGSREGLASVVEGRLHPWNEVETVGEGSDFRSILYQPADCADSESGAVELTLYDVSYREAVYRVPTAAGGPSGLAPPDGPVWFSLRSGCAAAWPRGRRVLALAYRPRG